MKAIGRKIAVCSVQITACRWQTEACRWEYGDSRRQTADGRQRLADGSMQFADSRFQMADRSAACSRQNADGRQLTMVVADFSLRTKLMIDCCGEIAECSECT